MSMMVDGRDLWAASCDVNLAGFLHYFIAINPATGNFIIANDVQPFGVLFEEPVLGFNQAYSGQPASVQFRGVGSVILGETLLPGSIVGPNALGQAVGHVTSGISAGMILQGGNYGNIVPVKLF